MLLTSGSGDYLERTRFLGIETAAAFRFSQCKSIGRVRKVCHSRQCRLRKRVQPARVTCGWRDAMESSGEERRLSRGRAAFHITLLKVNGWSVFLHIYTLFKTPGSLLQRLSRLRKYKGGLLKRYLLVFEWDSGAEEKKPFKVADSQGTTQLHRCLSKTGPQFLLQTFPLFLFFLLGSFVLDTM